MKRYVVAWAATAAAATGAAVAVLGLLGGSLTAGSGRVLDRDDVRAALASATARPRPTGTAAAPTGGPAPSPGTAAPAAGGRLLQTAGGTVIASCEGDRVRLRSWSPAQGFSVDGVEPGPALRAKVEFEPEEGDEVEVAIVCSGGRPVSLPQQNGS
ncbi:septum formation initiator [Nonomuraea sp. SMC257]|uniref:Septum formation initiator n=1 Tax=Nonomuraea montanisoli TaxID=2741721 RepID=A0A7Y6IH52_9ACTN|nr:septum formation initiator [Nonomuraea montanisoli]NUW37510.1 septum formation initiator [Nonomuraea montanisoli]